MFTHRVLLPNELFKSSVHGTYGISPFFTSAIETAMYSESCPAGQSKPEQTAKN
jgi:hypothetical protein